MVQDQDASADSDVVGHRDLRDAASLRALAHPVRLRILDELINLGPATATELSSRVGESAANCSWHLRQLARYGFIERAIDSARTGREHPWRAVLQTVSIGRHDDQPELARAEEAAAEVILGRELEALSSWRESKLADDPNWRNASFEFQLRGWMTAEELAALRDEIDQVIQRHLVPNVARLDLAANRPSGCRPVRLVCWAIPAGQDTETNVNEPEPGAGTDSAHESP
jgi:DNA-binding transcriptional ArsR family regulator